MKRCPQCEFIYEDEQTVCDMDGHALDIDATGAAAYADTSVALVAVKKWGLKSAGIPALIGTVLAALLFLAFYASPLLLASADVRRPSAETLESNFRETATSGNSSSGTGGVQSSDNQSSPTSPDAVADETASEEAMASPTRDQDAARQNHAKPRGDDRLSIRRGVPPLPRLRSLPRLPPAQVGTPSTSRGSGDRVAEPKNDSKVGSLLKKTGRILKKPFKL